MSSNLTVTVLYFDSSQFSSVVKRGPNDFFKGELAEEEDVPQFKAPPSSRHIKDDLIHMIIEHVQVP